MLNFLLKNLRIFTYYCVFTITSVFLSALVFQERIFTNKFLGFYFTYFSFSITKKKKFRVYKYDENLKIPDSYWIF